MTGRQQKAIQKQFGERATPKQVLHPCPMDESTPLPADVSMIVAGEHNGWGEIKRSEAIKLEQRVRAAGAASLDFDAPNPSRRGRP